MNVPQHQIESIKQSLNAEAALKVFFTLSLDLLCIRGKDGDFEQLNPAWEKVLGWTHAELLHMSWIELVHPEDKRTSVNTERQCNEKDFVEYENRYRHKDGSYRWLSWRVCKQEDGLFYGVAKDITTAKQSEEALRRGSALTLRQRLELEKLIANLSTKFIHLCSEEIDDGINHALQVIGKFFDCDRSFVVLFTEDRSEASVVYEWYTESVGSLLREWQHFPTEPYGWFMVKLNRSEVIQISTLADVPPEAVNTILAMQSSGTQSMVSAPMVQGKSLIGYIGFATVQQEKRWSDDSVALLRIVGEIFANALSRKQAEQKLQRAVVELTEWQNRYETVGQISGQLLYDWNQETNELILGRNVEKVLGYSLEELKGGIERLDEIIHPDDLEKNLQELEHIIAAKVPFHIEYRLRKKDGTYITVEDNGRFYPDSTGKLTRMMGVMIDITERKRAEIALKESEERWQLALRANNDGIWDLNIKNNQVFYSARWKEMLGYEDHEVPNQGEEWTKRVHFEDLEWVSRVCRDHVDGKTPYFIAEYRIQCKDGSYKWILDRGQALRDESGNLVRIIGSHTDISERKQAEFALIESEERWQLALRGSNDGIWDWNIRTNEVFHSARMKEILGYEEHQFSSFNEWATRVHPDDFDWVMQAHYDHLEHRTPYYSAEYRIQSKDGGYKWILDRGQALWDETGSPVRMVGSSTDISDRKQAEAALQQALSELEMRVEERTLELKQANEQLHAEIAERQQTEAALRQSEEQFRRVFNEAPIGMVLTGLDYHFFRVNRVFCEMLGYTESELMTLTFRDITHPEDLEQQIPYVEQSRKGEISGYQLEKRYLKKNQEILWANLTTMALRDDAGELLYVLAMVEDITERKQALEALQQSEACYRAIVEDQTELVCRYKPDGTLTFVNDAYCRYFNQESSDLIGHSFMAKVPEEDQELLTQKLRSLSLGQPTIINEHRIILPSGEIRWNQWIDRAVVFDEQGNVIELQAVGRDITELKQAEAEMCKALEKERELNELRSGFVSLVSHEFRSPLTTIQSSAELLERYSNRLSEQKKQNHLTRIQTSVNQMTHLIEEVLTIGKAEAGKLRFEPAEINLVDFCRNIVETLQLSTSQHTLTFVAQGACSDAQMDAKLLGHIVTNLLSNAIKYSPQEGTIRFDLICHTDSAVFQIQDSGIGIPQDDLQYLFESFGRASNVGTIPGTGLGLAIVKNCVDIHGGQIAVKSEVGVGTTFIVTLPLNYQPPAAQVTTNEN